MAELFGGEPVFGECKWWSETVGVNVLEKLEQNAGRSGFGSKKAPRLLLFSRKGFNAQVKKAAKERSDMHLLEPKHLLPRGKKH